MSMHDRKIANLLTTQKLLGWLRIQDPRTPYNYGSVSNCLLARYLLANGIEATIGGYAVYDRGRQIAVIPNEITDLIWDDNVRETPTTYGEVLERAEIQPCTAYRTKAA